jgi:hypothetical protein
MNDEFEQRLARHSLRAAPPEVTAELIAALRSQRADTRVQASVPRTPRDSGDSGLSAAVWRTLGLLWASALAMLCWSILGLQTPSGPLIRLSPEQAAEIRAERAALWELANFQESPTETTDRTQPSQRPPEPKDRARPQRPRSQRSGLSHPILGDLHQPRIQISERVAVS